MKFNIQVLDTLHMDAYGNEVRICAIKLAFNRNNGTLSAFVGFDNPSQGKFISGLLYKWAYIISFTLIVMSHTL